ncbi:uncharacterized protein L199_001109 [Kwoniella botswanensis]|uniref:uncharacterized protein n=1 Tax=Kwoniella botswanensis TaxID=1268659 RepID=UPI00315DEAC3
MSTSSNVSVEITTNDSTVPRGQYLHENGRLQSQPCNDITGYSPFRGETINLGPWDSRNFQGQHFLTNMSDDTHKEVSITGGSTSGSVRLTSDAPSGNRGYLTFRLRA